MASVEILCLIVPGGGDLPPPRNDLSTAGLEEEEEALGNVIAELEGEHPQAASSPTREPGVREKPTKRKGGR